MANVKRIVDTKFWRDEKVIDKYSAEDKYFLLYLMTNPQTKQVGIYKLPKKVISFETGYTREVVEVLLDRFQNTYKNIQYNHETQEVTILNSLKYSVVKGGKPVEDCIKKELRSVEDVGLIVSTYEHLIEHWALSERPFDQTVKELFEFEIKKRKVAKEKNTNDNDNDNDNERLVDDSYHDSLKPKKKPIQLQPIMDYFNEKCTNLKPIARLTDNRKKMLNARIREHGIDAIYKALDKARASDFMGGQNNRSWTATFDWIFKPNNFVKVLEGNYDNKGGGGNGPDGGDDIYDLAKHGIGITL